MIVSFLQHPRKQSIGKGRLYVLASKLMPPARHPRPAMRGNASQACADCARVSLSAIPAHPWKSLSFAKRWIPPELGFARGPQPARRINPTGGVKPGNDESEPRRSLASADSFAPAIMLPGGSNVPQQQRCPIARAAADLSVIDFRPSLVPTTFTWDGLAAGGVFLSYARADASVLRVSARAVHAGRKPT
jgi:hypothetical protein